MARSRQNAARLRQLGPAALAVIRRQQWLDRPSYRLEHLLSFAFNSLSGIRNTVMNALHGVWLGHPVHPPLASLTTGALGTSVALDTLSLVPVRPAAEVRDAARFARRALGIGILASIASAVTGATDWQHTHGSDRRVGVVHGVINLAATALYAQSWWDRGRGRHGRGMALTAMGYAITLGGSYLGGALVFGSGIGVDRSGQRLRTDGWRSVLPINKLNGKPVRVEVDGMGLVVCQTGPGVVSAFGEFCPHLAAPMADGWVDRDRRAGGSRPGDVHAHRAVPRVGNTPLAHQRAHGASALALTGCNSVLSEAKMNPSECGTSGPAARVMIVDDEDSIIELLSMALEFQGFTVCAAKDGTEAMHLARKAKPDVVLLDVMLPGMDGFEVLQRLRGDGVGVPVLLLSARDSLSDRIFGLTHGADDYVTKPFSIEEVATRLRTILKRSAGRVDNTEKPRLTFADIELDLATHEVFKADELVSLSPTEFTLLRYFMLNAGKVLTKANILEHVWHHDIGRQVNAVVSYVSFLRRKIDTGEKPLLHTLRGVGYVLRELPGEPQS